MKNKLTVKHLDALKDGAKKGDGNGLWIKRRGNGRIWLYRWTEVIDGQRKERSLSLGSYPAIGLAKARELANYYAGKRAAGIAPKVAQAELLIQAEETTFQTLEFVANEWLDKMEPKWKISPNGKCKRRMDIDGMLKTYVYPIKFKGRSAKEMYLHEFTVDTAISILEKMPYNGMPKTGKQLQEALAKIFAYGRVKKYFPEDRRIPFDWINNLNMVFGSPRRIKKTVPMRACSPDRVYDYIQDLRNRPCKASAEPTRRATRRLRQAMEFAILTVSRVNEVRLAKWQDFDMERFIWTKPAETMKMGIEHNVPLTVEMCELLGARRAAHIEDFEREPYGDEWVFPGRYLQTDKHLRSLTAALGEGTFSKHNKRHFLEKHDAMMHGFRTSFREWAEEPENLPREFYNDLVLEFALAHDPRNDVGKAYMRGDLLAQRREIMKRWTKYVTSEPNEQVVDFEVVRMQRAFGQQAAAS